MRKCRHGLTAIEIWSREMVRLPPFQAALEILPDEAPSGVDIPALIQTALAGNAADPADGVAVYIRQAVQTPRLTNAEQLLLMRKARVHREAFIGLMLQLDLVLLEVGARLERMAKRRGLPSRACSIAMAPWRAAREEAIFTSSNQCRRAL